MASGPLVSTDVLVESGTPGLSFVLMCLVEFRTPVG